jgi:cytochrome c oxidase assembly factor CtaG
MFPPAVLATALLIAFPAVARPDGGRVRPGMEWRAWNWDPLILLSLGLMALLYVRGLARLWHKVGRGHVVSIWQAVSFAVALGVIFVALVSPLDAWSEGRSSFHMVQHMLLMTVAAPLFVFGSPSFLFAWGLPEWRHGWGHSSFTFAFRVPQEPVLWKPLFLWGLFAATLWTWHHPALYQAALRDPLLHDAQHVSFFVVSCLYWRACLDRHGAHRLSPVMAVPYLFTTSVHASALGVFLALSTRVWYADYAARAPAWDITPLEDQQLAGLIMWMPSCLVYPAVAAALLGRWLAALSATGKTEVSKP